MKTRKNPLLATTAILVMMPFMAQSQSSNPGSIVGNALGNMPNERAAEMVNRQEGEDIFDIEDAPSIDEVGAVLDIEDVDAAREFDENGDSITQDRVRLLDETGLIGRQSRIAEGLLMMDQQVRFAQGIEKVLVALGPDAKVEIAPGQFMTFEGTPAAIKAEIELIKLQQELQAARAELMKNPAEEAARPLEVSIAPPLPRDDGSDFMRMPQDETVSEITDLDGNTPEMGDRDRLLAEAMERIRASEEKTAQPEIVLDSPRLAEFTAEITESQNTRFPPISLREIYGFNGVFTALIDAGGTSREVKVGDRLPGGIRVISISPDHMMISRNDEETRIDL